MEIKFNIDDVKEIVRRQVDFILENIPDHEIEDIRSSYLYGDSITVVLKRKGLANVDETADTVLE